jgi:polyhydroxybutyrate depolymerase
VVHSVLTGQHDASASAVYAVGFSNGGRMAYRLACDAPGTVDAIAAVEAVPVEQCARTAPLPVLVVANRFDPLLTIPAGARPKVIDGTREPTVSADVAHLRTIDGCSAARTLEADGLVVFSSYDHCDRTGRVVFAEYAYGHHDWSHGDRTTPSAEVVVWAFLDGGGLPRGAHPVTAAAAASLTSGDGRRP